MKKIFSILILFFAFSLSANAQETFSEEEKEATKKQAYEIANYFEITDMQKIIDINNMLLHRKKVETTDFSLEKKSGDQSDKIATIRWWDIPGESCQIYNLAFVNMALQANACLLFLEAASLLNDSDKHNNYLRIFQTLIEIINHNKTRFNLGIIISKCDLVVSDQKCWQNLQLKVKELEQKLREQKVNHRFFYSTVLIDSQQGTLQANQALDSLSWLLSQIDQQLVNFS